MRIGKTLKRDGIEAKFVGYCTHFGRPAMRVREKVSGRLRVWVFRNVLKQRKARKKLLRRCASMQEIYGIDRETALKYSETNKPWDRK